MERTRLCWRSVMVILVCVCFLGTAGGAKATAQQASAQAADEKVPPRSGIDTLTTIRRRGQLRVGISTFIPWAMRNKQGDLMGFEVDVAKKLADDLGVEVLFFPVSVADSLDDLQQERFDIIATGLYVTPSRALFVNFSDVYNESGVTLLANRQTAPALRTEAGFNRPGVKLGTIAGTVYTDIIKTRFPRASVEEFADEGSVIEALLEGKLPAAVVSSPLPEIAPRLFSKNLYTPLPAPLMEMGEAFAIRKGDPDFLNYLNSWIRYYRQNGWLKERHQYWFGTLDWAKEL